MIYDYQGKTAIVTGGAKGIGKEVVQGIINGGGKGIGKEVVQGIINGGGKVALLDIDDAAAQAVAAKFAGKVKTYHVDQGNRHEVNEQFSTIIDDFGKIDVLINVAGVISAKFFDSLPPEEWVEQSKLT